MADSSQNSLGTRERILEAAGEVFAEKGFRDATIREIVKRADANLNAVNYHFRDKEGLYMAVFDYVHQRLKDEREAARLSSEDLSAEQKLDTFVQFHLRRMLSDGKPAWLAKLRAREMVEPTGIMDALVEKHIRPIHDHLVSIMKELLGEGATDEQAGLCAISVVAQCLHYHHAKPIITRLRPEIRYDEKGIEALAEHITQFSLAAIKSISENMTEDSKA